MDIKVGDYVIWAHISGTTFTDVFLVTEVNINLGGTIAYCHVRPLDMRWDIGAYRVTYFKKISDEDVAMHILSKLGDS